MKNKIIYLIGAILIILIVSSIGYVSYISAKENYRKELKNVIDNKYLEGKQEIGAYDLILNDIPLNRTLWIKEGPLSLRNVFVQNAGIWDGVGSFGNQEIISIISSDENNYEWFHFLSEFSPFLIIVKKTDRGYDIIGEYIVGVGVKYSYPSVLLKSITIADTESYYLKPDLVSDYVNYLFNERYKYILIRNERNKKSTYNNTLGNSYNNPKKELLNELVTRPICKIDESLFFRTNKYFELKYDNYFTEIGSGPITWFDNTYGNEMQNLFTRTVTLHYSIQENKGVLENEYKNLFMKIGIISLILYSLIIFLFNKRKGGGK